MLLHVEKNNYTVNGICALAKSEKQEEELSLYM